jgi:hypothetical protein
MDKDKLKAFLYEHNYLNNREDIINTINGYLYLYEGKNYKKKGRKNRLSKYLKKVLIDNENTKSNNKNDFENLDDHINSYTNILFENRKEYVNLLNNIDEQYKKYLDRLFSSRDDIVNIIFAEAPPLIKNSKNVLIIKYIFDNNIKKAGNYRVQLYKALGGVKQKGIEANDLIDVCVTTRTLFMDLIPIALPFSYETRINWSTSKDFFIEGKPLIIILLELAIENAFKKLEENELSINDNFKPCFILPVTSSMGIFDYYNSLKIDFNFGNKRMENASFIESNSETKVKSKIRGIKKIVLPLYKRNGVASGNSPNRLLIKNALE